MRVGEKLAVLLAIEHGSTEAGYTVDAEALVDLWKDEPPGDLVEEIEALEKMTFGGEPAVRVGRPLGGAKHGLPGEYFLDLINRIIVCVPMGRIAPGL